MRDDHPMQRFIDALSSTAPDEATTARLHSLLVEAETSLARAKLALASGDPEAASRALDEAAEAHLAAQALRGKQANKKVA